MSFCPWRMLIFYSARDVEQMNNWFIPLDRVQYSFTLLILLSVGRPPNVQHHTRYRILVLVASSHSNGVEKRFTLDDVMACATLCFHFIPKVQKNVTLSFIFWCDVSSVERIFFLYRLLFKIDERKYCVYRKHLEICSMYLR